jgi:hypothetical protein
LKSKRKQDDTWVEIVNKMLIFAGRAIAPPYFPIGLYKIQPQEKNPAPA